MAGYLSLDTIACPGGVYRAVAGGGALYAALGARAAGARVRLVAKCCDDFPRAVLERLAALRIDLDGIEPASGATRTATLDDRHASPDRSTSRVSAHYAEASWWTRTHDLAPTPCTRPADMVVLTAMPAASLLRHLEAARRAGGGVVVDTSEAFAEHERDALLELLPQMDLFAPSRAEVRLLLPGLADAVAQRRLAARCPRIVQKRGPDGFWWTSAEHPNVQVPSQATNVVDSTGAGDAAAGALASGLAAKMSVPAMLDLAAKIAARAVGAVGPTGLDLELDPSQVA